MSTQAERTEGRLREWAIACGSEAALRARDGAAAIDVAHVPAPAAQIERIVQNMEQGGRWREARALRVEYFMAGQPEQLRLQRLKRLGFAMSRASYYVYLDTARAFISGALLADEILSG